MLVWLDATLDVNNTVFHQQDLYGNFRGPGGQSRRHQAWEKVLARAKELALVGPDCSQQQMRKGLVGNTINRTRGK